MDDTDTVQADRDSQRLTEANVIAASHILRPHDLLCWAQTSAGSGPEVTLIGSLPAHFWAGPTSVHLRFTYGSLTVHLRFTSAHFCAIRLPRGWLVRAQTRCVVKVTSQGLQARTWSYLAERGVWPARTPAIAGGRAHCQLPARHAYPRAAGARVASEGPESAKC